MVGFVDPRMPGLAWANWLPLENVCDSYMKTQHSYVHQKTVLQDRSSLVLPAAALQRCLDLYKNNGKYYSSLRRPQLDAEGFRGEFGHAEGFMERFWSYLGAFRI